MSVHRLKAYQNSAGQITLRSWRRIAAMICLSSSAVFYCSMFVPQRLLSVLRKPAAFTYFQILKTAPHFVGFQAHLLVYNGTDFEVYSLGKKNETYIDPLCPRCEKIVPLLVTALRNLDADRFQPGKPVFQVLFSTGDSAPTDCSEKDAHCDVESFAPVMLFGSAPVNGDELPQVRAFPNWFYISCLYNYKILGHNKCQWDTPPDDGTPFDQLDPTLIWRGSDFSFLPERDEFKFRDAGRIFMDDVHTKEDGVMRVLEHWTELVPRWRAVAMTMQAELHNETWIDAKFVGNANMNSHQKFKLHGMDVRANQSMPPREMARYKYQIDFGGGGGTSWRGTLTKLGLPGVLFHHQTPTKDWFYDEMHPWVHYIPVAWHLGDLKEKYMWAVAHEDAARVIARRATELFNYFMSEAYMNKVYTELFVDYLGEVMKAHFDPLKHVDWAEIRRTFEEAGCELERVATCTDKYCTTYSGAKINLGTSQHQVS